MNKTHSKYSFYIIISVFFFWGFVAASNGILIPLFKEKFALSQFQSQFVDLAFYMAYTIGAIVYYLISQKSGDPLIKIGYKKGLVYGLLLSAVGSLLFIPASILNSYPLLLFALFIIGLGFALQQIVANPLVINFGNPEKGSQRLNLAGGINSFGTTIGPVVLSYLLFGEIDNSDSNSNSIEQINTPALILFFLFVLSAIVIIASHIPKPNDQITTINKKNVFRFPQLTFGMIAIFVYVGVEVSIQSNLAPFLKMPNILGLEHTKISHFISLYWGSLMIGRWNASVDVFEIKKALKLFLKILMPIIALALIYFVNYLRGSNVSDFHLYIPFVLIAVLLMIYAGKNPLKLLLIMSIAGMLMMILGLVSEGSLALYAFLSGGLFCSVMWPCIFTLAISGLGNQTNQGSSLLVMMIMGGAIIPPIQGWIADQTNPHLAYIVTVFCFAYLVFYALKMKSLGLDKAETISH
ncbi:MAG: MFS transporter [Bacteroidota bacterium]|nr:MFS transporter [Bacteroidota bacterium]